MRITWCPDLLHLQSVFLHSCLKFWIMSFSHDSFLVAIQSKVETQRELNESIISLIQVRSKLTIGTIPGLRLQTKLKMIATITHIFFQGKHDFAHASHTHLSLERCCKWKRVWQLRSTHTGKNLTHFFLWPFTTFLHTVIQNSNRSQQLLNRYWEGERWTLPIYVHCIICNTDGLTR